jgi:hypothetical protein
MIKSYPLNQAVNEKNFVPQAVISEEILDLASRTKLSLEKGKDDLDYYEGTAALLDGLLFTIMHYRGHPPNTCTIYLPFEIQNVGEITKRLTQIRVELGLSEKAILWQRKDGMSNNL